MNISKTIHAIDAQTSTILKFHDLKTIVGHMTSSGYLEIPACVFKLFLCHSIYDESCPSIRTFLTANERRMSDNYVFEPMRLAYRNHHSTCMSLMISFNTGNQVFRKIHFTQLLIGPAIQAVCRIMLILRTMSSLPTGPWQPLNVS